MVARSSAILHASTEIATLSPVNLARHGELFYCFFFFNKNVDNNNRQMYLLLLLLLFLLFLLFPLLLLLWLTTIGRPRSRSCPRGHNRNDVYRKYLFFVSCARSHLFLLK